MLESLSDGQSRLDYPVIRVAHIYSSLLNVAGDGGNLSAIEHRAGWRGIATAIVPVEVGETPDFAAFDMIFIQGGQDVEMAVAADDLQHKGFSLREAADQGVVIFAVCAGLQLLGHRYIPSTGAALTGIGLLDLETRAGPKRFMQHAACEVHIGERTGTVVGFENHSGLTELGRDVRPFGKVLAGAGNNGVDGTEGAIRDNVYATYLHGPVLPKNPWLADRLIQIALERKVGRPVDLPRLDDAVETSAHIAALNSAERNRGRRTALEPALLLRTRRPAPEWKPPSSSFR
jgi:lipid II isoglutaminyl synthase (glutamine-hydrolysing)